MLKEFLPGFETVQELQKELFTEMPHE